RQYQLAVRKPLSSAVTCVPQLDATARSHLQRPQREELRDRRILYVTEESGFSNYPTAVTNLVMTVGSYHAEPPFILNIFSGMQVLNNWSGFVELNTTVFASSSTATSARAAPSR